MVTTHHAVPWQSSNIEQIAVEASDGPNGRSIPYLGVINRVG